MSTPAEHAPNSRQRRAARRQLERAGMGAASPVTEAQRLALLSYGLVPSADMRWGQASDALAKLRAQHALREAPITPCSTDGQLATPAQKATLRRLQARFGLRTAIPTALTFQQAHDRIESLSSND